MVVKQFVVNAGLKGKRQRRQRRVGGKFTQQRNNRTSTSGDDFRISDLAKRYTENKDKLRSMLIFN